ncbi:MAG: hypothetical protein CMJ77_05995 [Planctomycetaceae bacterium]|nr:hypothetical protein [Planctomycetaceae bacterium]
MSVKESGGLRRLIGQLFRPLEGKTWFTAATLMGFCALGLTCYFLWNHYGHKLFQHEHYGFDPNQIQVTEQPDWIRSNVTENAIAFGSLEDANLLDQEFVLQVKQAFAVQPWVKRVKFVNKQYPSSVEVELEYRRPIAMVEVPAGMFEDFDEPGLLPVDIDGCLLPVELSEQEAAEYPWISGINTSPAAPPGNAWGDKRVLHAARIIGLLEEIWGPLQLSRIEVPNQALITDTNGQSYNLITRSRRKFAWGSAPGAEQTGEDPAKEKVALLRRILESNQDLDSLELNDQANLSEAIGIRYARQPRGTQR